MSTVTITVHDAEALDGRLTVRRVEAQPASGPYKPAMPEHYAIELDRHYVLRIDADALAPLLAAAWDEGGSAALTWVYRQEDADAAGQYVHVPKPRNPYRTTDPKEEA